MKKFLSYFFPIVKKVKSPVSGVLEVTWYGGKKVLDSANANYSYGSLQRILKFGLQQIELSGVKNILLLGMGGGSVIQTLRNDFNFKGTITAIDVDPVVIDLAVTEFGLVIDEKLIINCTDAFDYVQSCIEKFDLIIVDLFIDNRIPGKFYEINFWNKIISIVNNKGFILFNTMENSSGDLDKIKSLLKNEKFELIQNNKVEMLNRVFIWRK